MLTVARKGRFHADYWGVLSRSDDLRIVVTRRSDVVRYSVQRLDAGLWAEVRHFPDAKYLSLFFVSNFSDPEHPLEAVVGLLPDDPAALASSARAGDFRARHCLASAS